MTILSDMFRCVTFYLYSAKGTLFFKHASIHAPLSPLAPSKVGGRGSASPCFQTRKIRLADNPFKTSRHEPLIKPIKLLSLCDAFASTMRRKSPRSPINFPFNTSERTFHTFEWPFRTFECTFKTFERRFLPIAAASSTACDGFFFP